MPTRPVQLKVSLSPQLQEMVQQKVDSGRYESASEVIREGLRLLERVEQDPLEEARAKIQHGVDQAKRGELRDGDSVFDDLDREIAVTGKSTRRSRRKAS